MLQIALKSRYHALSDEPDPCLYQVCSPYVPYVPYVPYFPYVPYSSLELSSIQG